MDRTLPLADKCILITRSKEQASYFSKQVQKLGGTPLEVPLIQFSLPANLEKVASELEEAVAHYEWLVFTSVNGVNHFFQLHNKPLTNKIAAVGSKTKEALAARGYETDLVPSSYSAENLVEEISCRLDPSQDKLALIQGNLARPVLREELLRLGYNVKRITVYENKPLSLAKEEIEAVVQKKLDLITFTSPSTVHNFKKAFGLLDVPVAVIGPITEKAAVQAGFKVSVNPEVYTIDGLLKEIITYFQREDT
ncbi:uroporphyrinogen-III synthase [Bacillus tianshenii]|uniref:uroporphyrinogen-III synthase n=1 Tax=Sutcliffiella tianshenii TaxID=1463404 RepID=UPI001CD2AD2B|nr:uroporphyrinogen-III synthase [Bacillus tianshenii]MCA1318729.1 uroporphyrinogen-III synthase [Bacillus tianshenii]